MTGVGVLVECDPSIKAIILKIDSVHHDFIIEDLDDQTLVIKEAKLKELKLKLDDVRIDSHCSVTRRNSSLRVVVGTARDTANARRLRV